MKYLVTLNGKKYEVEVEKGQATAVYVGQAESKSISTQEVKTQTQENQKESKVIGEGTDIKSPMPGTILQINVEKNESVKAGDVLFILEAMKMENEIVAPSDGIITSVLTSQGATVETDTVLATLK